MVKESVGPQTRDQPGIFLFLQLHLEAHRRALVERCRAFADHHAYHPGIGCGLLGAGNMQPERAAEARASTQIGQRVARQWIVRERIGALSFRKPHYAAQLILGLRFMDKLFDEVFSAAFRCARTEMASTDRKSTRLNSSHT